MRIALLALSLCLAAGVSLRADPDTRPGEPATRPALFDLSSVLRQLPREARPPKAGWDEFTRPKAHKWIVGQLLGKPITIPVRLKSVTVERIPKPGDPDETEAWKQSLFLEPVPVKGLAFPASQSIAARAAFGKPEFGEQADTLVGYVTEDEARRAKDWKPGQPLLVSGDVVDVEIRDDVFVVVVNGCTVTPGPKH